jgi:hypothetical protein
VSHPGRVPGSQARRPGGGALALSSALALFAAGGAVGATAPPKRGLGTTVSGPVTVADAPTGNPVVCVPEPPMASLLAPGRPRGLTRVRGSIRPFFNVLSVGGGAIADLAIDHYFVRPIKVGLELDPTAIAFQPRSSGAVTHLRVEAAFASDYLEVGAAVGGRLENFAPGGISLAGRLRLGALDGLNFRLTYGYAVIRNRYTGQSRIAFSNVLSTLEVPLLPRVALVVDGGFSFDVWLYGTIGLRHTLVGDGGRGTWMVRAAFGLAWVLDQFPCQYLQPERCEGAAWGVGPTIAFGLERRF